MKCDKSDYKTIRHKILNVVIFNRRKLPNTTEEEGSNFSITALITALTFSNNSCGSCSYHPGLGLINCISCDDIATISAY